MSEYPEKIPMRDSSQKTCNEGVFNRLQTQFLDPERLHSIINDPRVRASERPELMSVAAYLQTEPKDKYLQEYAQQLLKERITAANSATSPFDQNSPPQGSMTATKRSIAIGRLPTGDIMHKSLDTPCSGTVVTGLPGTGKSTLAGGQIIQKVRAGELAIVWDVKGTWKSMEAVTGLAGRVVVLSVVQFVVSLLCEPPGCSVAEWANRVTKLIAQDYGRMSSQRVFRDVIEKLLAEYAKGSRPSLSAIVDRVESLRATSSRDRDIISGLEWVLKDIRNHLPGCFEYTKSDFLQKLVEQGGRLIVIEDPGLPHEHRAFLIDLVWEYAFAYRRHNPESREFRIVLVLEDSGPLLDAGRDHTAGGISTLAQNLNLGRELDIELMAVCHSLGQVSRKILPNIDSIYACSLRGDDMFVAQQVLGISHEEAEYMRTNPLGTACALVPASGWPKPVLVSFPKLEDSGRGS